MWTSMRPPQTHLALDARGRRAILADGGMTGRLTGG